MIKALQSATIDKAGGYAKKEWVTYGNAHEGLLLLVNLAFRHFGGSVCEQRVLRERKNQTERGEELKTVERREEGGWKEDELDVKKERKKKKKKKEKKKREEEKNFKKRQKK